MRPKQKLVLDVECYRNYFMVGLRNIDTRATSVFELYEGCDFDRDRLERILHKATIVTFNGIHYDIPMVTLALSGAGNKQLKIASDTIIHRNLKSWEFENSFGVRISPRIDHIDLIEVAPGQASLKIYGGRVHTAKMQDLPIEVDAHVTAADRVNLVAYNGNDLNITIDLYNSLLPQIALRESLSDEYGIDLRSKSDAQIAEAVIKSRMESLTGSTPKRPEIKRGTKFRYQVPDFLVYSTPAMMGVLELVRNAEFTVSDTGSVEMPPELDAADVSIGNGIYRMGIGGLHSSETSVVHHADDDHVLIDRDVASYYPAIILGQQLCPKHLGSDFLKVFKSIVDRRLAAKRSGDKVTANALKITVNGTFGKLGSKWSCLYSPHLMIQVTMSGQLALLMLIERIESAGIPVVSANTDGVVIRCPIGRRDDLDAIVAQWETDTSFETEETEYRALYSRDVNNYIAIKTDGEVKLKGAYATTGLQKNPTNQISAEAVVAYLTDGLTIEKTILECTDLSKFVTVRQVNGGAVQGYSEWDPRAKVADKLACLERSGWQKWPDAKTWANEDMSLVLARDDAYKECTKIRDAVYVGKAVRWYYGIGEKRDLRYKTNSNSVPRTRGAVPMMDFPEELPSDLDHTWYIREAFSILRDVGHPRFQYNTYFESLI